MPDKFLIFEKAPKMYEALLITYKNPVANSFLYRNSMYYYQWKWTELSWDYWSDILVIFDGVWTV